MADTSGRVESLTLTKATGMWAVRTEDDSYLLDADARALTLLDGSSSHPLHGLGWLSIRVVHQALTERTGVLQVGALHMLGVVPPNGADSDTLFVKARPTSIEQATPAVVAAGPARRRVPRPDIDRGPLELVLDESVGVWAVHGEPGSQLVYIDTDAHAVLGCHAGVPPKAERWQRLKNVRGTSSPSKVVRIGEPVTMNAARFPGGRLALDNVTGIRRVATDELATLPERVTPQAPGGEGDTPRVVIPKGRHVTLEVPGEPPWELDDELVQRLIDVGLHLPPEHRQPKPERVRLVVDGRAKFVVDGRDIGAKKGLRAVRDAVSWAIRRAVDATRASQDETDTGVPDPGDMPGGGPNASAATANELPSAAPGGQARLDPGAPVERYVDVENATHQLDELVNQVAAGARAVVTRDGIPAAVMVAWSTWCKLNADLAREEYAYWSSWDQGVFDDDQYADLIADWPHRFKNAPLPPAQRRWQR